MVLAGKGDAGREGEGLGGLPMRWAGKVGGRET